MTSCSVESLDRAAARGASGRVDADAGSGRRQASLAVQGIVDADVEGRADDKRVVHRRAFSLLRDRWRGVRCVRPAAAPSVSHPTRTPKVSIGRWARATLARCHRVRKAVSCRYSSLTCRVLRASCIGSEGRRGAALHRDVRAAPSVIRTAGPSADRLRRLAVLARRKPQPSLTETPYTRQRMS